MRGKPEPSKSWFARRTQLLCRYCRHLQPSWRPAKPHACGLVAMPATAAILAVCIPTLRAEPLGFRPVLAVGFRETMSWAGRHNATQGHDLMRGDGVGGHA